jgi:hypothetical protein
MHALRLNGLSVDVQRVVAVAILVCMVASLALAVMPQKAMATDCEPWQFERCCESSWPCRQDEQPRWCYYLWHYWQEWRCNTFSICDLGC